MDQLLESINSAEIDMHQLTKLTSSPILISKEIDDILIQYISIGATVEYDGSFQKDYYGFSISNQGTQSFYNGKKVTKKSFLIIKPLSSFQGIVINKLESITISIKKELIHLLFGDIKSGIYYLDNSNILTNFYNFLYNLLHSKLKIIECQMSDVIFNKILYLMINSVTSNNNTNKYYDKFKLISDYIHNHLDKDMSIQEIAKEFNVTDRTIRNIFSYSLGLSPKQYQKSLRLNHLKKTIIKEKNNTITDSIRIQKMQYQSLIAKDFKNLFGQTPNQFKVLWKNKHFK